MSLTKASYSMMTGSTVNVLDYGASPGASSAVNGAAFEAALTYLQNNTGTYQLGGGILTVPEGIYAIDRPLTIGLYTVMQGYGPLTTYLVFDSTVTTSDIFIGPSTQPGNTYGYTYASGLRNIAIKGGGNEDHIIYSAGMHQFSVIENVSVKFVNTTGISLNNAGGPAYNFISDVWIEGGNEVGANRTGIVVNCGSTTQIIRTSIEGAYGEVFDVGLQLVRGDLEVDVLHLVGCTQGVLLLQQPVNIYADRNNAILRNVTCEQTVTDAIVVEANYRGGFIIESCYSYAGLTIGGATLLKNNITGETIAATTGVTSYIYPSYSKATVYTQTGDSLQPASPACYTANCNQTTGADRVSFEMQYQGTQWGKFFTGVGSGPYFAAASGKDFSIVTGGSYFTSFGVTGNVLPLGSSSGNSNLGEAGNRWNTLFCVNAPNVSSDRNLKQQIRDISVAEKAVALRIKGLLKAYKFNSAVALKGDKARIHIGVIAQDVGDAFRAEGLDPDEYGLFCYDEWPEQLEVRDEHDQVMVHYKAAGSVYSLRYEELLVFMIAAL
jgi:hypothetical protein